MKSDAHCERRALRLCEHTGLRHIIYKREVIVDRSYIQGEARIALLAMPCSAIHYLKMSDRWVSPRALEVKQCRRGASDGSWEESHINVP